MHNNPPPFGSGRVRLQRGGPFVGNGSALHDPAGKDLGGYSPLSSPLHGTGESAPFPHTDPSAGSALFVPRSGTNGRVPVRKCGWVCGAALLVVILAGGALCRYALRRVNYYRRYRYLAEGRLRLLRRLLEVAYLYRSNPPLFQRKFYEEVSIDRLECCDIICGAPELKRLQEAETNPVLTNRDILLCILLDKGFTPQELSVVYGMSNYNSIYVRVSRIRKRRAAAITPKIALSNAPKIEAADASAERTGRPENPLSSNPVFPAWRRTV